MTTTDAYVLGRTDAEYERLRVQARIWQDATATLFDRAGLSAGARCLDVGCGPGETMRLMAERTGPGGTVTGMDVDATLGTAAVRMLHDAGHRQCRFVAGDAIRDEPPPGGYDLVFARLLLMHVTDPVTVLRRMWEWTAPGGHLVVQDYDLRTVGVYPDLPLVDEWRRVFLGTFTTAGREIRMGHRLPALFAEAGIGEPDGIEVAGRMEPLARAGGMLTATYRSVAPAAISLGVATEAQRDAWLTDMERAVVEQGGHTAMWPLMIGAYRAKARR
ncbi:methyltransferase domain-containing protein [Actinoplanes sp. NPDC024001]|uniref:methyltransferase domain-containing protein n=1 Tax=Actinoplanes sp. NPDC024001 TaxID=3154598 RepID=UPI0033F73C0D